MKKQIDGVIIRDLSRRADERGWLTELFRQDELPEQFRPAMSYISMTKPGVTRGPHEHRDQDDFFCFIGASTFRLYLWDNRPSSPTFGLACEYDFDREHQASVLVPKGVVHAYRNIGTDEGVIINLPNRLYAGIGRREPVDEIRHENDPNSPFKVK